MTRLAIGLIAVVAFALAGATPLPASGPLGLYGIIDKVVFESSGRQPERVQIWGAFMYVDGGARGLAVSNATRGYLYFRLPETGESIDTVRKEWADLEAVAGTGQAVGFGSWGYIGPFTGLNPGARATTPPYIIGRTPTGNNTTDIRVRPASEAPASPAWYQTNAGVVRLSADGSHASIVAQLKAALAR